MNLDSLSVMQKLDSQGVYLSIGALPDQMNSAWEEVKETKILPEFKMAQNAVVAGMGGSGLGGRIVQSLFSDKLHVPIEVMNGYHLPHYVNENSLVILSSYSGNTEETISQAHEALKCGAMIYGIATDGKLAKILFDEEKPGFIFVPKHNPSGQPRMSLGYSIFAIASLLTSSGLLRITNEDAQTAIAATRHFVHEFSARQEKDNNPAKMLAYKIKNQVAVLVSSEHLFESAHAFKNQLNENAKTFSMHFGIPELNHHLMEGLRFPGEAASLMHFLMFSSKHYSDRVQKRYKITQEVLEKNNYESTLYTMQAETKIEEACEMLVLGSYVSFYAAMLHEIDPAPIPWVDYFKQAMEK